MSGQFCFQNMPKSAKNIGQIYSCMTVGSSGDARNRFFYFDSVFEKKLVRFKMSFVRFGLKMRFGSDIIVIYYSCSGKCYSDSG